MWTRLSARTVLELFCVARQAERSVDRILGFEWGELIEYYTPEKVERIESLLTTLRSLLPEGAVATRGADRDEIGDGVPLPGRITVFLLQWFAPLRKIWRFRSQELAFVAAVLGRLLRALKSPVRPPQEALITLRRDLWMCEYVIECRCYGLPGLKEANRVEHLWPPLHIKPVRIIDLVGPPKHDMPVGKAS
jgi:hypothetical protein